MLIVHFLLLQRYFLFAKNRFQPKAYNLMRILAAEHAVIIKVESNLVKSHVLYEWGGW